MIELCGGSNARVSRVAAKVQARLTVAAILVLCAAIGLSLYFAGRDLGTTIVTASTLGATLFAAYTAWLAKGTAAEAQVTQVAAQGLIEANMRSQERQNARIQRLFSEVIQEGAPEEMDLADAFDEEPTDEELLDAEQFMQQNRIRLDLEKERFDRDWSWLMGLINERKIDPDRPATH